MGQYWKPVNLDKREYIDPRKLGAGLKLWEQLANPPGVGAALVILLACMPERRGGGDLNESPIVGRWAGDRITFVGDYSEARDLPSSPIPFDQVYDLTHAENDDGTPREGAFVDVTDAVIEAIEVHLEGKFLGDGWRQWVPNDQLPKAVANKLTRGNALNAGDGAVSSAP